MPIAEVTSAPPNQPGAGKVYTQTTDPGAVGAGALWLNTTAISLTTNLPLSVRNAANSAWLPVGLAMYASGVLRAQVTLNVNGGVGIESRDAAAAAKSYLILKNTTARLTGATSLTLRSTGGGVVVTTGDGSGLQVPAAAAAAQAVQLQQVSPVTSVTSGALSTVQLVSGTGVQISTTGDVEVHTPVTFNPGVATTATCTVALSPDNVTYSTLCVWTEPVGVAFAGTIMDCAARVPAGWFLKLTVNAQAVLGLSTFY